MSARGTRAINIPDETKTSSEGSASKNLEEAHRLMKEDEETIESLDREIVQMNERLEKEKKKKEEEYEKLCSEVEDLKSQNEHIEKLTSASRDARKMYGDMTPGDTTHHDVTLLYQNHFKDALRNMPKKLNKTEGDEKYQVWEMCANIVQESFEENRKEILDKMVSALETTLTEKHETLNEETRDLQRAFEMLLQGMKGDSDGELQKIVEEVVNDNPGCEEEAQLVMDIIETLKPDDYMHFIETGKPLERKLADIVLTTDTN